MPANFILVNNASTTLAAAAAPSATTLTIANATNFPSSIPAGFVLPLTLNDAATRSIFEVVYVTAISGTSLTVERGQESTTAQNWGIGDFAYVAATKGFQLNLAYGNGQTYAADAGTTNAYSVSLTPALTAHLVGVPITWKAANTNTGASTFNDGAGSATLTTQSGAPLPAGFIVATGIYESTWDGTKFQVTSSNSVTESSVFQVGTKQLAGTAPGGTKTATFTIGQIIAATALTGTPFQDDTLSLSFNGATVGANGMDAGSTPTSADLFIYAIYDPTTSTWASLGTTVSNTPIYSGSNMPAGFTASVLVWAGKTDSSGNIVTFNQINNTIYIPRAQTALNNVFNTSWTLISIASIVPVIAKTWGGRIGIGAGGSGQCVLLLAADSAGVFVQSELTATWNTASDFSDFPIMTAQSFWYEFTSTTGISSSGVSVERYTI